MSDWQPGERGIIGLPIVMALQSIGWRSDGTLQIHEPRRPPNAKQNLCFDGLNLMTRAQFEGEESEGKELDFVLDTGNQTGTQLWRRFGTDFAALMKQGGTASRKRITNGWRFE